MDLFRASGIPLPKGVQRSRSSSNLRESASGLSKRSISRDGRSSIRRSKSQTPLNRGKSNEPSARGKSSAMPGAAFGITPQTDRSKKSRTPTLGSKGNEKCDEHYMKLKGYIQRNTHFFDSEIVNINTVIKPPSLAVFLHISSVLFNKLFYPHKEITSENYKTIIPNNLKVLGYTGTLTASSLKCVYISHSWPQIAGMFAFLVNWIELLELPIEPDSKKGKLTVAAFDYLHSSYILYNDIESGEEEITENEENFIETIGGILGFNPKDTAALMMECDEIDKHNQQVLAPKYESLKTEQLKLEEELEQIRIDNIQIEECLKMEEQEEENFERHYVAAREANTELEDKWKAIYEKLETVDETIQNQTYNKQQLSALETEILNYRTKIEMNLESLETWRQVKDDLDSKSVNVVNKIQKQIHDWNLQVVKLCYAMPEFKKLLLPETRFHSSTFLKEIDAVIEAKCMIEENNKRFKLELNEQLSKIETELRQGRNKIEMLEKCNASLLEDVEQKRQKCRGLEDDIALIGQKLELTTINFQAHIEEINEEYRKRMEADGQIIANLKQIKRTNQETVTKFKEDGLKFLKELHSEIIFRLQKVDFSMMESLKVMDANLKEEIKLVDNMLIKEE